jgi:hypothetical protein
MIYMFMAGDRQAVKIGFADDVFRRRKEVQVGNHLAISLFRQFEGSAAEEAMLHAKFGHLRLRGEWFSYSREMEGDVGLVEIFEPTREIFADGSFCGATDAGNSALNVAARTSGMKLSEYLSANGLTYRQFAERIGKSVFQVHRWATDKRTPDLESAVEIERITDGAVRPCDFVEAAQ